MSMTLTTPMTSMTGKHRIRLFAAAMLLACSLSGQTLSVFAANGSVAAANTGEEDESSDLQNMSNAAMEKMGDTGDAGTNDSSDNGEDSGEGMGGMDAVIMQNSPFVLPGGMP